MCCSEDNKRVIVGYAGWLLNECRVMHICRRQIAKEAISFAHAVLLPVFNSRTQAIYSSLADTLFCLVTFELVWLG